MGRYVLHRLFATLPVVAVVTIVVFLLLHLAPGDPAAVIAGDNAAPQEIERIRVQLGLDRPLLQQFWIWLVRLLHGDLGVSIYSNLPVMRLIGQRIGPTLSFAVGTLVVSALIAVTLGVVAAVQAGKFVDHLVMLLAILGLSAPVFVVGYLMALVFSVELEWLPVQGYSPIAAGLRPYLSHLVLPTVALALNFIALIARMTRASMLEVLAQDYIRTAHAQGYRWVSGGHGARPEERLGANCHHHRHRRRPVDQRGRDHRKRIQHSWYRPVGGRCHHPPRLSDHPGNDSGVRVRLRLH
jgi:peptide/nickel transport system permease protein